MISSVQMFPSTLKLDLFVTAFGVLAPEGQLIRTGGHMHHSKSAVAMSGDPPTYISLLPVVFLSQAWSGPLTMTLLMPAHQALQLHPHQPTRYILLCQACHT